MFDILFIGAYTKDTIVRASGERTVDGGAFYYGANVAARMDLSVAAVTRLAGKDFRIVRDLESLGVRVSAVETARSTRLRIDYPSENPDERTIRVESSAGSFSVNDLGDWSARVAVIGASFRGEVPEELLQELASRGCRIALDAQGFVRVVRDGILSSEKWPEAERLLPMVSIFKADADEAEIITGSRDPAVAAPRILDWGVKEALLTDKQGVRASDMTGTWNAAFDPDRLVGRSGRGDTCLAAYAAQRISQPPSRAVLWAAAATSLKLEGDGPFHHTMTDVRRRAARIEKGTRGGEQ
jgi:sugar/nucleoside kinase (ribokinase family)